MPHRQKRHPRYSAAFIEANAGNPDALAVIQATQQPARKFGNKKVTINGITFDSKAEARRYEYLTILEHDGQITGLQAHPRYTLLDKNQNGAKVTYSPDFVYTQNGRQVAEDVKGGKATQTQLWRLKWRLFQDKYPDLACVVVEA